MRTRLISALLVVFLGAGLYTIRRASHDSRALATLGALEAISAAASHVERSALLLLYDHSANFDNVQKALRDVRRALDVLDSAVEGDQTLMEGATVLREHAETQEERVLRLLGRTGSVRNGRHTVARLLNAHATTSEIDDSQLLSAWLAFAIVPSEGNHAELRHRMATTRPESGSLVEDLQRRGQLLAEDQSEAQRDLVEILDVPIGVAVANLRREAQVVGRQAALRARWLAVLAIVVVGGLTFVVQRLVGRLEKSRNFERGLKENLELEVAQRTRELTVTNQKLADDIERRQRAESERDQMEVELRHAQKLEAVGRLAAGIAHEINTPAQYVSDNTRFLKGAFEDVMSAIRAARSVAEETDDDERGRKTAALGQHLDDADIGFLETEVPSAFDQCLEGLDRVSTIVRAMKDFSHPGQEKSLVDLNRALDAASTVARNEWKYVADLDTDFDPDLPSVPCVSGELNQVFLNMIVNAAHAIADVVGQEGTAKGSITIRTRREDDHVVVTIADTGAGMTEEVRQRIFDPFFTTKEVGKGTGQGLAIAHSVIHDKHGGRITVESAPGEGTAFHIALPLDSAVPVPEHKTSCVA